MASSSSISIDLKNLEERPFPHFKKPNELAVLSTVVKDKDERDCVGDANLEDWWCKYTVLQQCGRTLHANPTFNQMTFSESNLDLDYKLDLNVGHGTQIKKERDNEFMNILLECLVKNKLVGNSDFVCWRGLLTRISVSPYDMGGKFDDGMIVVVQKLNGIFYMYEFPTQQALIKEGEVSDHQKLMQYWGMKFESYVTAKPDQLPTPDEPMNFNHEFASVVYTKLDSHSLMYGGEVDCCFPNDRKRYVELKTTREFQHRGHESSFRRFKLIKWWLQSFLIGIDDILCGFRDDNGFVRSCKWYKVSEVPQILKQDRDFCKPSVCFAFLNSFLNFVKSNVHSELQPHVIIRQPGEQKFHLNMDDTGKYNFLPYWFAQQVLATNN